MKIRTRIMSFFLVSILSTTLLAVSASTFFGRQAYYNKVIESGEQALQAVTVTLEQMMADIRRDINVLFWNSMIQEKLEELNTTSMTPEIRLVIQDTLSAVLLSEDAISSILFWDNRGDCCYSYREGVMLKSDTPVSEAPWYPEVYAAGGEWIYETDGGGITSYAGDNKNVITMMRTMKLKSDYAVCGMIMVNIDAKTLRSRIASIAGEGVNMAILSGQESLFESKGDGNLTMDFKTAANLQPGGRLKITQGGHTLLYQKTGLKEADWQLLSATAMDSGLELNVRLIGAILGGNIALMLVCWLLVSHAVSRPLEQMADHLAAPADSGIPADFVVDQNRTDEISTLKLAYNRMLSSIRELMRKTTEKEKSIQRGELELILSQVSPHFLYNTLDTISGMILSGDEKRSFKLVQLLGKFYRNSLNGGQQLVTLKEEMETVKSYLNILNTRYGGTIAGAFELPKELENRMVLKLMLQPLVENAVHHGLRPKGVDGRIIVTAARDGQELILSVWDNGVGMSEEKIREILHSERETTSGFGIFSIRQRIQLFYEVEDPVVMESCEGKWTRVTIHIPGEEKRG